MRCVPFWEEIGGVARPRRSPCARARYPAAGSGLGSANPYGFARCTVHRTDLGTGFHRALRVVTSIKYRYYYYFMRRRHSRTLQAVYDVQAGVKWGDIEAMLGAAGCHIRETQGSMVRVVFPSGSHAVIQRPHPSPEMGQDRVRRLRRLLMKEKITP